MDKKALRDTLFEKYFQIDNGVLVSDFMDKLSFIADVWKELHLLCEKNINCFNKYSSLEKCKILKYRESRYLIIKLRMWRYVIIDIDKMRNITPYELANEFDEDFFANNFDEIKDNSDINYLDSYLIERYEGNIQELVDFYIENQKIFHLPSQLHYRLKEGSAWTWFRIDFANESAQMGFQTQNQFLYEQLFLSYDLTPYGLQDAQQKMGIEKMQEIFSKIKSIMVPIECIPNDLYQQYLIQCNNFVNKRMINRL